MRPHPKIAAAFVVAFSCAAGAAAGASQYPPGPPPDVRGYPSDPYRHSTPDWEVGFFYQELSPFGDWIFTAEYGWTWMPRGVRVGWRPYYYGQWVWSDYGWLWLSHEPFGWATYHYGRWSWHPRLGWIWVPGRTWGPSWVAWQYGDGWIGWAPLPPEIGFEIGIGLRFDGFDLRVGLQPHAYTFVEERRFLEREAYRYAAPPARNVTIIQRTTNITNITIVENRIVNRGVDLGRVERATGRRVRALRVAESPRDKSAKVRGDEVVVYRPPKSRLDTVKVDERKLRRERAAEPAPPPAREMEVAPRVPPPSPSRVDRLERDAERQRRQLEQYERAERERLEKLQREERAKQKAAPPERSREVSERHERERAALAEQAKREKQQLEARQEVARKAAQASPPGKKAGGAKKAEPEKGRAKEKPRDQPPPPR
jgi:hypothetical protein